MLEFDRGTERKRAIQRQAERYRAYPGLVVWVLQNTNAIPWITDVSNKENTLYKLEGSSTLFDYKGREIPVAKVCSETLALIKQPGTET